ncbi:MAG: hypothetical protein CL828_09870 [Crocinitomicaceae bacterium]|nr:hypothetical protein [Crocinitomicaceae bacterium]
MLIWKLNVSCLILAFGAMGLFPMSTSAQSDCGWNPDFEQDYAIGITDVLAILGVFGAVDNDQDGLWDVNDLCEDMEACNYNANPTEACLYEDALGVCGGGSILPELLIGSWQFSTVEGAVSVGPDPYSNAWYSSPANGLQNAQYDDVYTFHPNGSLTTEYNGSIIDAFSEYAELVYDCSSPAAQFYPSEGTSGEDAIELLSSEGVCECPFIGTNDAGLVYDIVTLNETTLVLHAQGDDADCNAAGLYFTFTFNRITDDTGDTEDGEGYPAADTYEAMTLVWSDEFDGTSLNLDNWTYDLGASGWGNNEWQNYTNSTQNSSVADGYLTITARQEGSSYTSARLKSQGLQSFQYGRMDIRAKLPEGQGIWPAIWMLGDNFTSTGWPACGEIDIMEMIGHQPSTAHGTAHWGSSWNFHQYTGSSITLPNGEKFSEAFHLFSVIWEENQITWLMDDQAYFSIDSAQMNGQPYPFNAQFFFIMNIAVGGNWPGYPDATTEFPQHMVVDCIRVFQ